MKAAWVYVPRPGSLTAKVGAELLRLGRPITRMEIIRTFEVKNERAVHPNLLRGVQRGYLVAVQIDGMSGYDLASRAATPDGVEAASAVGAALRRISTAPKRACKPLRPCPDETGIDPRSCWPFGSAHPNPMEVQA